MRPPVGYWPSASLSSLCWEEVGAHCTERGEALGLCSISLRAGLANMSPKATQISASPSFSVHSPPRTCPCRWVRVPLASSPQGSGGHRLQPAALPATGSRGGGAD